ncbi:MAG: flippase [bacterium]|nr:flippase [bacterium]
MFKTKQLLDHAGFMKHFRNISWILGEKVLRLALGLFVGILVARYLGPERFGILAYALSLMALFAVSVHMGLGGLVIRDLVKKPDEIDFTLGTTFLMKFAAGVLAVLLLAVFAFATEETGSTQFWMLLVVSVVILFRPFETFSLWFDSQVQARYNSLANGLAGAVASLVKVGLVLTGAHLLAFAFVPGLEAALVAVLLVYFYKRKASVSLGRLRASLSLAGELLGQSWIIMLGTFFAIVYLKIDQVMLRWLADSGDVGVYAVASQLSEVWYFVPTAIVASLFPKLIRLREENHGEYTRRLQQLFDLLFNLALGLAVVVTLVADPLIRLLYGSAYENAGLVLAIHIWAGLFIFMRSVFSKWILIEDALVFSLITQGLGALSNIAFNFLLIPIYGIYGAAVATLLSYAMASYISLAFYRRTRSVFWMMSRSMISPIRYALRLAGRKGLE